MATFEAGQSWFPKIRGSYVAYIRCSDRPNTKLSVEAQHAAIRSILSPGRAHTIATFVEREPVAMRNRAELAKAIEVCRDQGAALIFGRIGGMRGSVNLLDGLFQLRIKFRCADMPTLTNSNFYRLKAIKDDRRRRVSAAVTAALAEARKEGKALGGVRASSRGLSLGPAASLAARQREAGSRDSRTMREIKLIQRDGIRSLTDIAARLDAMGSTAPRGGPWSATQVRRVIERFAGKGSD